MPLRSLVVASALIAATLSIASAQQPERKRQFAKPSLKPIRFDVREVLSGLCRYWRADAIPRGRGAQRITVAMATGSVIGATVGGLGVAYAPVAFLKVLLGCVLLAAAAKTFTHKE